MRSSDAEAKVLVSLGLKITCQVVRCRQTFGHGISSAERRGKPETMGWVLRHRRGLLRAAAADRACQARSWTTPCKAQATEPPTPAPLGPHLHDVMRVALEHRHARPPLVPVPQLDQHVVGRRQQVGQRWVHRDGADVVGVSLKRADLWGRVSVAGWCCSVGWRGGPEALWVSKEARVALRWSGCCPCGPQTCGPGGWGG